LTVIDEDDEDAWVNVVISVEEGYGFLGRDRQTHGKLTASRSFGEDESPFKSSSAEPPEIPRKPKKAAPAETNGAADQNGDDAVEEVGVPKGVKRTRPDDDGGQPLKKAKMAESAGDDIVIIEDAAGAIVIGDD
jgi:ubiquitin-like 1-activating enzyme E1 B